MTHYKYCLIISIVSVCDWYALASTEDWSENKLSSSVDVDKIITNNYWGYDEIFNLQVNKPIYFGGMARFGPVV